MRAVLAAALTTLLPAVVGRRWVSGSSVLRWSLGAVVGVVLVATGAVMGGLLGTPVVGAALTLVIAWFVGPRLAWRARSDQLWSPAKRTLVVVLIDRLGADVDVGVPAYPELGRVVHVVAQSEGACVGGIV